VWPLNVIYDFLSTLTIIHFGLLVHVGNPWLTFRDISANNIRRKDQMHTPEISLALISLRPIHFTLFSRFIK